MKNTGSLFFFFYFSGEKQKTSLSADATHCAWAELLSGRIH